VDNSTSAAALLPPYHVLVAAALAALAAVLVGALPIAVDVLRAGLMERRVDALVAMAVPVLALLVMVGYTLTLEHLVTPSRQNPIDVLPGSRADLGATWGLLSWCAVLLLVALASVIAVTRGVRRAPVADTRWRFALVPAMLAALAMGVTAGAALILSLTVQTQLGQGQTGLPGGFQLLEPYWSLTLVGVMALATLVAAGSVVAGLRAARDAAPPAAA